MHETSATEPLLAPDVNPPPINTVHLCGADTFSSIGSLQGTSAVTFYSGASLDQEAYLLGRVRDILQLNPWLGGYLVLKGSNVCVEWTPSDRTHAVFKTMHHPDLDEDMCYEALVLALKKCVVKMGRETLDKPLEPLFRVTLVSISSVKFALVCSTSHVLCDGHDFYNISSMLSIERVPTPLTVQRLHIEAQMMTLLPDTLGVYAWLQSAGFRVRDKLQRLLSVFGCRPRASLMTVNHEWLAQQKKAALLEDVPFVSSNDVLVSHVLRLCRVGVAILTINLRGRIENLFNHHLGSYTGILGLLEEDFSQPIQVRRALQQLHRRSSTAYPSFWSTLFNEFSVFTNWASLYQSVFLPTCIDTAHIPLKDASAYLSRVGIIAFRLRADTLGLVVVRRRWWWCLQDFIASDAAFLAIKK